ncbi:DNA polymerase V [Citrobacter freundii]
MYTVFLSGIQEGLIDATTQRFVQELSKVNWNWTMKQPNEWIEWYVTTFRDVSTQEGENRTFQLFNPNGGL